MTKTIDQRAHRQDGVLNQDALSRDLRSSLPVIELRTGEKVRQGVIYLAPADHHLLTKRG